MKYVMFECKLAGMVQKVPVIFPEFMVHADVAQYFGHVLRRTHKMEVKPVSAGLVDLGGKWGMNKNKKVCVTDGVEVHGSSETMKLKSDPEDATIIQFYNYTNGVVG